MTKFSTRELYSNEEEFPFKYLSRYFDDIEVLEWEKSGELFSLMKFSSYEKRRDVGDLAFFLKKFLQSNTNSGFSFAKFN